MRFACQSCGKAYSLPEERIADKSNVKLKCRVCGAIVEVKRQGEVVATVLDEVDGKRVTRVSEAPAPLNTLTPEDDEADGATVSISEGSINERGPLQFEMPSVPLAPPTGFGGVPAVGMPPAALPPDALSPALAAPNLPAAAVIPPPLEASGGLLESPNVALGNVVASPLSPLGGPPLGPPPLSPSSLPPPPLRTEALAERPANGAANGRSEFFGDDVRPGERNAPELLAPVAPGAGASLTSNGGVPGIAAASGPNGMANVSSGSVNAGTINFGTINNAGLDLSEPIAEAKDPMFKLKMLAAFATGVMVDRIISGLFQ